MTILESMTCWEFIFSPNQNFQPSLILKMYSKVESPHGRLLKITK